MLMKTHLLFSKKNVQLATYSTIVLFCVFIMNHNSSSLLFTLANSFTLLSGFFFLYVNTTKHLNLIKERRWAKFFLYNILIFLICYFVSVILYTIYLTSLGESSFQLKYIFMTSYPYRSNIELITLYALGFIIGQIRRKHLYKILKTGIAIILICVTSIFAYERFSEAKHIDGVEVIEGKFSSVEEIISLPQFQNKLVYVDLWHSSCSPCIEQMQHHLPTFKQAMKDANLEIEYLYLGKETSGPMSEQRWWNVIEKYNLKGWHYYMEKTEEKQFWKTIVPVLEEKGKRSYGYPQYLIAQSGKLIEYDAPYPEFLEEIKTFILSQTNKNKRTFLK